MSHESENILPAGVRLNDICEYVLLLGYRKVGPARTNEYGRFETYHFYDEKEYRSWSGVQLTICIKDRSIVVSTRTTASASYHDSEHQNKTIYLLKKRFGGKFITDEGTSRYLPYYAEPFSPAASGCHIAFHRFGSNLINAMQYIQTRTFPAQFQGKSDEFWASLGLSPRLLSNNLLLPYIVAALEDYFKSTFIALLRYSPRKQLFFKSLRLQGDHLAAISDGKTVEEQITEVLPFQKMSSVANHFESLDPQLKISAPLRRPYRRRKQTLFEMMESIVNARHAFIHRAKMDQSLTDQRMTDLIYDLDTAITRVYKHITNHYKWPFDRGWYLGKKVKSAR